jgi:hypothetical protein
MNWKPAICMVYSLGFALGLPTVCGFGQDEQNKRSRPSRVFTNDDLQKYQDNVQAGTAADVTTPEKKRVDHEGQPSSNSESSSQTATTKSYWADRLREAETNLDRAKMEEQRFSESLTDFRKKFTEAKTEFQKRTAQWQIEDTEKNLDRSTAERKKSEEKKASVLAEAAKKGFKAVDLKQEGVPTKASE